MEAKIIINTSFKWPFQAIRLFVNCLFLFPFRRLHGMLCEVVLNDDILFLFNIGAVRLHDQQLTLFELCLGTSTIDAVNIICIIGDFEFFLQAFSKLERPTSNDFYLGLSTPVIINGEWDLTSPSIYSLILIMGIPDIFVKENSHWMREWDRVGWLRRWPKI